MRVTYGQYNRIADAAMHISVSAGRAHPRTGPEKPARQPTQAGECHTCSSAYLLDEAAVAHRAARRCWIVRHVCVCKTPDKLFDGFERDRIVEANLLLAQARCTQSPHGQKVRQRAGMELRGSSHARGV